MDCAKAREAIGELIDGTLGPIRRAELEQHLDQCDACRALAADLEKIRDTADTLDRPAPPDHVWLQIAGRLRQAGRVQDPTPVVRGAQRAWLAIAAALTIAVGASLLWVLPRVRSDVSQPSTAAQPGQPGNAAESDPVQSGVEDLRQAERLLQSGIAKLKEGMGSDHDAMPAETAATLNQNLQILDTAIAESTVALRGDPQNTAARTSLFEALQRKISLLQDTITLMNEMRKGNAAGVAQVVEPRGTKS
jgi:hypothetical protein